MRRSKQFIATMLAASMVLSNTGSFPLVAASPDTAAAQAVVNTKASTSTMSKDGQTFTNPLSYTDVPDLDVIRVGDTYYMTSTTMHLSPGCPVMKSKDLVNWEIVNYVYDILDDSDACSLKDGQSMYSKGQWASSLRYHKGIYYVAFPSYTTNKTYIYQTDDIENGTWKRSTLDGVYHDLSLLFDDDDRVYMVYGSGQINIVELTEDATAIKEGGLKTTLVSNTAGGRADNQCILKGEGSHIQKINGKYYIFMIGWYINGGSEYQDGRMEMCFRSDKIDGTYERKEVLNDRGIAQGGIIDTQDDRYFGLLFKDNQSVGRTPCLVPVTWENDWPVFGENGKVPDEMKIPFTGSKRESIVKSDEFYQGDVHKTYSKFEGSGGSVSEEPQELVLNGGFDDGMNKWAGNDNCTLKLATDQKEEGDPCVMVTERSHTTSGPCQSLTGKVNKGTTYKVTAKVKYNSGEAHKNFNFCIKFGGSWSPDYNPTKVMTTKTVTKGEWATLEATYTVPTDADLSRTEVFVESEYKSEPDEEKDLMDFYVDDVSFIGVSSAPSTNAEEYKYNGSNLDMVWQWNHNPDNRYWSLKDRNGYLRLTTGSISKGIHSARNTLTQRTFGPQCSGVVSMDVSNMKNGDVAGLSAFQYYYGYVGVKMLNNKKTLVMEKMQEEDGKDVVKEVASVDCTEDTVFLKVDFDFNMGQYGHKDQAYFYYSYDGVNWSQLGDALKMSYSLKHFMGYRFGLFNYATKVTGGYVDFDYFHVSDKLQKDTAANKVLTASMKDQMIMYEEGKEIEVPVTLDAYEAEKDEELHASVSIPSGFTVSDVVYNKDNVKGETSYEYNKNGQLKLSVTGDVQIMSGSKPFATIKLLASKGVKKNTTAKVKVDYIEVTGEKVTYDLSKAAANLTLTWFDADSIGKNIGNSNPLINHKYGADPYALVYNGRVYIYMTSDAYEYDGSGKLIDNTYSKIRTITVISSADMVNWTDHGEIKVSGKDSAAVWANNSWAPAVAHKKIDGKDKFFLYFANNASSIGVLEADSPVGPWSDPIGKPIITPQVPGVEGVIWCFDPAVLVDDDGNGYLYFGGGVSESNPNNPKTSRVIKLGDDMISTEGSAVEIDAPAVFEDSGIHKYKDTYYYSYCSNFLPHAEGYPGGGIICYMTSKSPMGPFEYKGEVLDNPGSFFGVGGNNHHAFFEFKGENYITYHAQTLGIALGITQGYRSTHINKVEYNEDGTIKPITADLQGVSSIATLNPYERVEAETIAWNSGVETKECGQPGSMVATNNLELTGIHAGDWVAVSGVDFGEVGADKFTASVAASIGGKMEIHLDSPTGELIGSLNVASTEGEDSFKEVTTETKKVTGVHNVFFTFMGEVTDNLFNMDYWKFDEVTDTSVKELRLNKTSLNLNVGQSRRLHAIILPISAADHKVDWTTSNKDVAIVDQNGKVTAVGVGTAVITAKAGSKSATCTVTVKEVPVTKVILSKKMLILLEGKNETLKAYVVPHNATNKEVTWETSNDKVATVDENGNVTAKKAGTVTITATAGEKSASCKVTVIAKPNLKLQ